MKNEKANKKQQIEAVPAVPETELRYAKMPFCGGEISEWIPVRPAKDGSHEFLAYKEGGATLDEAQGRAAAADAVELAGRGYIKRPVVGYARVVIQVAERIAVEVKA